MKPKGFHDTAVFADIPKLISLIALDSDGFHAKDEWGFTALHGVVGEERHNVAKYLIKRVADVSAKNDGGTDPLHLALKW